MLTPALKNYRWERLKSYALLMRWHRPIGIYLLLWPTLWALWVGAQGLPPVKLLVIFSLGVMIMRSAGCIINDLSDKDFDAHVQRTAHRPLVTKAVNHREALSLFLGLGLMAFGLVCFLNTFTMALAVIALLLACFYPLCKRFTSMPQLVLGCAYGSSVLLAFASEQNHIPLQGWYLFALNILWTIIYDTMYAMNDRAEDVRIGVKSTAVWWGDKSSRVIGLLQVILLAGWVVFGWWMGYQYYFFGSLLIVAILMAYQQYLLKHNKYIEAFNNNNWVGMVIFLGLVGEYFRH